MSNRALTLVSLLAVVLLLMVDDNIELAYYYFHVQNFDMGFSAVIDEIGLLLGIILGLGIHQRDQKVRRTQIFASSFGLAVMAGICWTNQAITISGLGVHFTFVATTNNLLRCAFEAILGAVCGKVIALIAGLVTSADHVVAEKTKG